MHLHTIVCRERVFSVRQRRTGDIFAVKKFDQYLYGRHFVINSDHKPLQYIFSHDKPVPPLASARLQRWALLLGAYDYRVEYKRADQIQNADGLSRLPLPESPTSVPIPGEMILLLENLELVSLKPEKIKRWTDRDPILSQVRFSLCKGWKYQIMLLQLLSDISVKSSAFRTDVSFGEAEY